MTNAQVFMWFCKEQNVIGLLFRLYHEVHPYKTTYSIENGFGRRYIGFEEYISAKINNYGFFSLWYYIIQEYKMRFRYGRPFEEYREIASKIDNDFKKVFNKWGYFVRNCIVLNQDSIKVGDIVRVNTWGREYAVKITSIDVINSTFCGYEEDNENERCYNISFSKLVGDISKIDYSVKRNRRVYNGQNRK